MEYVLRTIMPDLDSAVGDITERVSKLDKIWPSKDVNKKFTPSKIICFVDANQHSEVAIKITLQLSNNFSSHFSLRTIFDQELLKLADTDINHIKESIIGIVKDLMKENNLPKGITFLEGNSIDSIKNQLSNEYDIVVLPVPYHSNLSDHPESSAIGSLGEYLVKNLEKPLFLIPDISYTPANIFQSVFVVADEVSDIMFHSSVIKGMLKEDTHLHFLYLYDEKEILELAIASKGVLDGDLVTKRVHEKLEQSGKYTLEKFSQDHKNLDYSVFSGDFTNNIKNLLTKEAASLLIVIIPAEEEGYRYLKFENLIKNRKLEIPILVLKVPEKTKEPLESTDLDEIAEEQNEFTEE